MFKSLSVIDGIVLKDSKIVIPRQLRKRVIRAVHESHLGIQKTKEFLRSKVWYPGVDKDAAAAVATCRACQAAVDVKSREPLIMSELPLAPWTRVAMDFYGPLGSGEYLLSIIDEYSRFPIIRVVSSTSAKATIAKLDGVFSEFGIPERERK